LLSRHSLATRRRGLTFRSSSAVHGCERRTVRPAHAAAGARASGAQEGEEDPATGASGTEKLGVPAAQAAGTLLPGDFGVLVVGRGGGGERGGRAPPERWEPSLPSPRAAEAAEETAPGVGAGAPAARQPTREATRAAVAPARAAETTGGAAVATSATATTPAEPPRKMKQGFSTLR
jgi:hypothetical protein